MHQSEVTRQGNGLETIKLGNRGMKQNNRMEEKNGKKKTRREEETKKKNKAISCRLKLILKQLIQ